MLAALPARGGGGEPRDLLQVPISAWQSAPHPSGSDPRASGHRSADGAPAFQPHANRSAASSLPIAATADDVQPSHRTAEADPPPQRTTRRSDADHPTPTRRASSPRPTATVGSAVTYAKHKVEMERLRVAGHPGPPPPPPPEPGPAPGGQPHPLSRPRARSDGASRPPWVASATHASQRGRTVSDVAATAAARRAATRRVLASAADGGPAPRDGAPWLLSDATNSSFGQSSLGNSSFGPSDLDADLFNPPLTSTNTIEPEDNADAPGNIPETAHPRHTPTRRRLAPAASPAARVGAALDAKGLAMPWREDERLTKLNSAMLRMGLHFDVPTPSLDLESPLPTAPYADPWLAEALPGEPDEELNPRLQRVLRHERHRLQELEERIERRDRRRECARRLAGEQRQRETQALRAAMWTTIISLHTHSLLEEWASRFRASPLGRCLVPIWRLSVFRRKRRRAQQAALAYAQQTVPRLTPAQLRATGALFQEWPGALLEAFTAELQLSTFASGEYICHQGDPSALLYVLVAGEVDVVLRRPDAAGKARGKRTGLTVAQLTPVQYVGEYGVFAGEPRAATLYCATPVVAWAATNDCLGRYLRQLPPAVHRRICTTFEANMATIYKVRPAQLASTILFRGWDLPTLEEVVAQLQPVLFAENEMLLAAGAPGAAVYIVAKGRCCCRTAAAGVGAPRPPAEVAAGALLGLRACVFVEGQECEVRALTTVQAWRLPKAVLMDFLLRRPDQFLKAKQRLNDDFAKNLVKPPMDKLFIDSRVAALPRAAQQHAYARLSPVVVAARDPVVERGAAAECVVFLVAGRYTVGGDPVPRSAARGCGVCVAPAAGPRPCWPATVVAVDRVEGWRLALTDLLAIAGAPLWGGS